MTIVTCPVAATLGAEYRFVCNGNITADYLFSVLTYSETKNINLTFRHIHDFIVQYLYNQVATPDRAPIDSSQKRVDQ